MAGGSSSSSRGERASYLGNTRVARVSTWVELWWLSVLFSHFHLHALLRCVVYVRDSPPDCGDAVAKAPLFCFIAAAPCCPPTSAPLAKRCFRRRLRQRKNTSAPIIARRKTAPPTAPPITAPDGPSEEAVLVSVGRGLATPMSLFRAPKYSSWSGRSMTVGSSLPTGQVELF
jgi:hypothetical protein